MLYAGSLVWHLLSGGSSVGPGQPLAYVVEPAREAYFSGCDACLAGYLLWQWTLLSLLWGFFGGALMLSVYLFCASFAANGDVKELLLGPERARA